jgi:hypothetical protein
MTFSLPHSIEILTRTPDVLHALLHDLSSAWTHENEGGESWSTYDIIGHLIHGELTDWMPRLEIILSDANDKSFTPFDRFAQFENSQGKSLNQLLVELKTLRQANINLLISKNLTEQDGQRTGLHPAFGEVTLSQLLSTWTVHDLNHIAQIARVMAHQYKDEVGPWTAYLRILQ